MSYQSAAIQVKPNNFDETEWNKIIAKIKTLDSSLNDKTIAAIAFKLCTDNSALKVDQVTAESVKSTKASLMKGLYIGLGVGAAVLIAGGLGAYFYYRQKPTMNRPRL